MGVVDVLDGFLDDLPESMKKFDQPEDGDGFILVIPSNIVVDTEKGSRVPYVIFEYDSCAKMTAEFPQKKLVFYKHKEVVVEFTYAHSQIANFNAKPTWKVSFPQSLDTGNFEVDKNISVYVAHDI